MRKLVAHFAMVVIILTCVFSGRASATDSNKLEHGLLQQQLEFSDKSRLSNDIAAYTYPYTEGNLSVSVGKNREYMNHYIGTQIESEQWASELDNGRVVICMFEGCGANDSPQKRANAACVVIKKINGNPTIVFQNAESSTLPDLMTKSNSGGMLHTVDGTYDARKIMQYSGGNWHGYAALHIDAYVYRFRPDSTDTAKFWCTGQINVHHRYWDGLSNNSEGCITISQNFNSNPRYHCSSAALEATNHSGCGQTNKYASNPSDFKDYIQFLHAANVMEATEIDLNKTVTGDYTGGMIGEKVGIMVIDRTTAYSYLQAIGYTEDRIKKIMGTSYDNRNSWNN